MGQSYSSSSSVKSRRSTTDGSNGSSIAQDFASIVKFVHSKPLSEEVFGGPRTSAHAAFKRYIEASRAKKRAKSKAAREGAANGRRRDSMAATTASSSVTTDGASASGGSGGSGSAGGGSGAGASSSSVSDGQGGSGDEACSITKFEIGLCDILNIQKVWPRIEQYLLPVGTRMYIAILDGRCEKIIICNKPCCNKKNASKSSASSKSGRSVYSKSVSRTCPNQVILNEELQKFVLLLMGLLRRTVKHLENPGHCAKVIRKISKKHFGKLNIDVAKIAYEPIALNFIAAVREIMTHTRHWNTETESSYFVLIRRLMGQVQRVLSADDADLALASSATSSDSDSEDDDDEAASTEDEQLRQQQQQQSRPSRSMSSSASSLNIFPTFDRHLVLVGCQTFQDFFDLHPQVLKHFDQYQFIKINEGVNCAEALKMHASKVLACVEDIVNNSGNPDKIRSLLQDLGKHHSQHGITEEHLDMLGPIVCHTIRPVVFKSGLWSIEVEKSWNHLFDMVAVLMKRGYPGAVAAEESSRGTGAGSGASAVGAAGDRYKPDPDPERDFPTLTHIIMLRDTWAGIVEQMHELGLTAVVRLFKINYNLRFYSSPNVRYHPATQTNIKMLRGVTVNNATAIPASGSSGPQPAAPATASSSAGGGAAAAAAANSPAAVAAAAAAASGGKDNLEHLTVVFNLLVSIIDHMISTDSSASAGSGAAGGAAGGSTSNGKKAKFTLSSTTMKQLQILRQPTDWVGPVFCNTVRPLLLVQGKWSYQVEIAWRLLFRNMVKKNKTFDDSEEE